MKKSVFIIAATALVVGCAQTDSFRDVNDQESLIAFSKTYIEKGTKAFQYGAYDMSNFETAGNTFAVFGYKTVSSTTTKVFGERTGETQGVVVTFGTDWSYSPLRYWDKTASTYDFYAYAPSSDKFTGTVALASNSSKAFSITGFEQSNSQSTMIDLMTDLTSKNGVSQSTTKKIGENDVEFVFNHILSNINIKMAISADLKSDETDNPVSVQSISIGAIKLDGTYDDPDDDDSDNDGNDAPYAWTIKNGSRTHSFLATEKSSGTVFAAGDLKAATNEKIGGAKLVDPNDYTNGDQDEQYIADLAAKVGLTSVNGLTNLLFIPQTVENDYVITINYKINDEPFEYTIKLTDFKNSSEASLSSWVSGYLYNYVLIIGPTPILFDVSDISEWTSGGTYEYIIK